MPRLPEVEQARRERLNLGLQNMAEWCNKRIELGGDIDTTLTMLIKKTRKLHSCVLAAEQKAWNQIQQT